MKIIVIFELLFPFISLYFFVIYETSPFFLNELISNVINFVCILCDKTTFNEKEVEINRKRIKKSREAIFANANKYKNDVWLEAANKLDEIILDKNIDTKDLKKLIISLIDKKEDINIIKKFLKSNKGVLLIENNELFDYCFNLALESLTKNTSYIYYYISLLKIFYSSKIDKLKYLTMLNIVSNEENEFANEIYNIINGIRRSLKPEEVLHKYGIYENLITPNIVIPNTKTNNELIFAVDSDNTELRDDAISLKKTGNKYIVGIHIIDPAKSFDINSFTYIQALNNYKNIYLPNGNTRIISKDLESKLSLDKNSIRNTISLYVVLNDSGDIIDYYIKQNTLEITDTFSYTQCDSYIDYNSNAELSKYFNELYDIACALENKNKKKKDYWKKKNSDKNYKEFDHKSDKIVRELMILYNTLIATAMFNNNNPFIYRTQDSSYFNELISSLNIKIDDNIDKIIKSIYLVSKYSVEPKFHNGLHIPIYSHSTCPLRRFPDLYNGFLLHNFYFKDICFDFNNDDFIELVNYCNQRNSELSLMRSEYNRALKLQKKN